jgi:two-component system chemotaxis response regulator CheY
MTAMKLLLRGLTHKRGKGWNIVLSFQNKRVLVVDDSQTMRMFIFFHLIKLLPGVQLREAENGLDAIEQLNNHEVDLILTDMNMPELDGAGVIRAVREVFKKDTPIIVITTKGEHLDRERGLALGANGYLTKPLDIPDFRKKILKFLVGTDTPENDP